MKLSESIKPISYFKANAAEVIRKLDEDGQAMVITQNGEAKAVLMGVREYDQIQRSMAMVRILAQSSKDIEEGRVYPADEVFDELLREQSN